MAAGSASNGQVDFGAGIYRGREAPENAAYDLLNCLIDDEGQPFRRGGSAYLSTGNAGATLAGLADGDVAAGRRTMAWGGTVFSVLSAVEAPSTIATLASALRGAQQPAVVGGLGVWVYEGLARGFMYGGTRKSASYNTGTVTVTAGSRTVTGAGTAWLANADAGMIFAKLGSQILVESVASDTSLTLRTPWPQATSAGFGYDLFPVADINFASLIGATAPVYLGAAGTVPRLLVGSTNRVYFSDPGNVSTFTSTNYHELPGSVIVVGITGVGDTALIFTTGGVWGLTNLDFDPLDDVGNVQHQVAQLNELILWGDAGLARWRGAVVTPAVDGVWLVSLDGQPVPIGEGIAPLYLAYVKAGYQPGTAIVHRGHYFLPILNGSTIADVLVCRLDRGFAWTRWSGHSAGVAYAQRIGSATRSPKLLSVGGQRVTELTDAWNPSASNASEADATTHPVTIETRDQPTPGGSKGSTTRKVRVRYEATAAGTPTFTVSYARGVEGASFTSLGSPIRGGGTSDGLDESVWPVGKQAPAIRYRITSTSALSTFKLRGITTEYLERGA